MAERKHAVGLARRSDQVTPLLDDPPHGHLQAIILRKVDALGPKASGYAVLEELSLESGVWLDPSQIYSSIRKLLSKGHIELAATQPQASGPPLKIYRLTEDGSLALQATAAHYQAVAEFLKQKPST